MTHLGDPAVRHKILQRIATLNPASDRHWGRMTAHQMVCHLADSFRVPLGEKHASPASNVYKRTVMKWIALYAPMRWPQGVATRPELDQKTGGALPDDFLADRGDLIALIERFADPKRRTSWVAHPIFGEMCDREWLRWGYLHTDHHLRQFGA